MQVLIIRQHCIARKHNHFLKTQIMPGKKKSTPSGGLVYSTNPDYLKKSESDDAVETLAVAQQPLRVITDKKQRAGKVVTLVIGFSGTPADREALGKKLKALCGAGGSVVDEDILIQGDHSEKVLNWLRLQGYALSRKG
jgi:translation initiation factor 1